MNKRKIKLDNYGISGKRVKELCGFCEQYPDWKKEISNHAYISAVQYGDEPKPSNHNNSDTTAKHAMRMLKYKKNVDLIERIAKEAAGDEWLFLIKAICYELQLNYLINYEGMSMSMSSFYEKRRYFFYRLDEEKNKIEILENA